MFSFFQKFGIKGTIGAVDCTHVNIISPASNDVTTPISLFMNRKGSYSLNVEAVSKYIYLHDKFNNINISSIDL